MTDEPSAGRSPSPEMVLLNRADVVSLLRSYQISHGQTTYYLGDPLVVRVREALNAPASPPSQ